MAETIPEKITAALNDAAKLNRVEPRQLDTSKGILFGWSRDFQTETVIALNPEGGLQIWYKHSLGKCKICPDRRRCKSILTKNATDLDVSLTREERSLEPLELSDIIFSRALGRVEKQ